MGRKGDRGGGKSKKVAGGSGGSNPKGTKYRAGARAASTAAARASGGKTTGPGSLTAAALSGHNDRLESKPVRRGAAGASAMSAASSDTPHSAAASHGTAALFAQVWRKAHSQLESDRETCAVLAAITETLKASGQPDTAISYWASLMATLEQTGASDGKTVAGIVFLLALVFPKVPHPVLQKHFSGASKMLVAVLQQHAESGTQALMKASLNCVTHLLVAQDPAAWDASGANTLYRALLEFSTDQRAKVRREAQNGVGMLIKTIRKSRPNHPIMDSTAKFVLQGLKGQKDLARTMYILNILKDVLPCLPEASAKQAAETLLVLMAGGVQMVYESCMTVFQALFKSTDMTMPPALLRRLLTALYQNEPAQEHNPRTIWNSAMTSGYICLTQKDPVGCLADLPKFCTSLVECYSTQNQAVVLNTTECLKMVMKDCFAPQAAAIAVAAKAAPGSTPVHEVVDAFASGLNYKYRAYYVQMLGVLTGLYEVLGQHANPLAAAITTGLVQLRATDTIDCRENIESTVGASVKAMGAQSFLAMVPLGLNVQEIQTEFPTAWLLPVLKSAVSNSQLELFGRQFVPLASHLLAVSERARQEGKGLVATTYQTLYMQVWDLLPSFCNNPVDVASYFPTVAPLLGEAITKNVAIRGLVCQSLITLIRTCTDKAAVAAVSRNYMLILLNVFVADGTSESDKAKCLSCIQAFVPISDQALLGTLLGTVFQRLDAATKTAMAEQDPTARAAPKATQHSMMDLGLAMAGGMNDIGTLYTLTKPFIASPDATLQKKAFKALGIICSNEGPAMDKFLAAHTAELLQTFVQAVNKAATSTKFHRLGAVGKLVKHLSPVMLSQFIPQIITEVIMCTKEVTERTRAAAFGCMVSIGEACVAREADAAEAGLPSQVTIHQFFNLVVAGLAGQTPHMRSATILSLSRLLYQFHERMAVPQVDTVLQTVCLLLQTKSREVLKAAISFVKVAITVLQADHCERHLKELVIGVVAEAGVTFRQKARRILEKLIRLYGYERVESLMPEEHLKLLANIRKSKEREKRAKKAGNDAANSGGTGGGSATAGNTAAGSGAGGTFAKPVHKPSYEQLLDESDDGSDADSESEDDSQQQQRAPRGRAARAAAAAAAAARGGGAAAAAGRVYIRDDAEGEDAVDFLDAAMATKLRSSAPTTKKKKAEGSAFPKSDDGRMFILDPEEATSIKKAQAAAAGADGLDLSDDDVTFGSGIHRDRSNHYAERKRARAPWGQEEPDDDSDDEVAPRGGEGKRVRGMGSEYKAKKAGGDVKLSGKSNPHAYMAFDKALLNKRKQKKAVSNLKGLMVAAQKGARTGSKKGGSSKKKK